MTADVNSVTKSQTPHILTEQLKNLDPSSPELIARVEEILNSDESNPALSSITPTASKIENPLARSSNQSALDSAVKMQNVPVSASSVNPPVALETATSLNNVETPAASVVSSGAPIAPAVTDPQNSPNSQTQSIPSTTEAIAPASWNAPVAPVTAVNETEDANARFETVGSVPDVCEPNPCHNGATCVIRKNHDFECHCTSKFSGPLCKEKGALGYSSAPKFFPKDECNHCDKDAECVNKHCICAKGFAGDGLECWPETEMDKRWKCHPNPCQNGGTCKEGRARCVCRLGYTGLFCENYCEPTVHLSFDKTNGPYVLDESDNGNNAILKGGAYITHDGGKCGAGAVPHGGDILFGGKNFAPKPHDAVTMTVWVKLDALEGIQSIFDTVGGTMSTHREGQYHLEIDQNRVRWFHRNEHHVTIFSIISNPILTAGSWYHIAGTYEAAKRMAVLYVNGDIVGSHVNVNFDQFLSQDWETKAGLGRHEHTFGDRIFRGTLDDFYIFNCILPRLEILVLLNHCKIYWKHHKEHSKKTTPQDPIFDVDTALNKESPLNAIALSETAKALEENLKKFQYYYGSNEETVSKSLQETRKDSPNLMSPLIAKELKETGDTRFTIAKPGHLPARKANVLPSQRSQYASRALAETASRIAGVLPRGPSSLYSELQGYLSQVPAGSKRMRISNDKRIPLAVNYQRLKIQDNANSYSKYHRAPVVRNENKVLPFAPQAYFNIPGVQPRNGEVARGVVTPALDRMSPSNMNHVKVNIAGPSALSHQRAAQKSYIRPKVSGDPRWFKWTKNLAVSNGVQTTNTHSNSLQKNDPGTVHMDNHVTSSQSSTGSTKIKNMYGIPKGYMINNGKMSYLLLNPASIPQTLQQEIQRANAAAVRRQQVQPKNPRVTTLQRANALLSQQRRLQTNRLNVRRQMDARMLTAARNRQLMNQRNLRNAQNPRLASLQKKQTHTTTHNHQWGFGNGNGNGNGVGSPGASGSGGGWGAGGPLSQSVNFPGWGGNPPDVTSNGNRFIGPSAKQGNFAPVTRELWNSILAQRRQSSSDMHVKTANTATSSVVIQPANGVQNGKVTAHQWGFGNGNGKASGQGSPGGKGHGGGWGNGGPTKQETWLPGRKSVIHNPRLPVAIVQSFRAPWLPQKNGKQEKAIANAFPFPAGAYPYQMVERSHIPRNAIFPRNHVINNKIPPPNRFINKNAVPQQRRFTQNHAIPSLNHYGDVHPVKAIPPISHYHDNKWRTPSKINPVNNRLNSRAAFKKQRLLYPPLNPMDSYENANALKKKYNSVYNQRMLVTHQRSPLPLTRSPLQPGLSSKINIRSQLYQRNKNAQYYQHMKRPQLSGPRRKRMTRIRMDERIPFSENHLLNYSS